MITKVKIDGYKSFKNFEMSFKELMVIFGPNSSGKSNLLDMLNLLSLMASEKNLKNAFENHRGLPLESLSWPRDSKGKSEKVEFEVDVIINDQVKKEIDEKIIKLREGLPQSPLRNSVVERNLRYNVVMEITKEGEARIIDESLRALTARAPHEPKKRNPFFEKSGEKLVRRMEGQGHPVGFDLGMDHTLISEGYYIPHHPHMAAINEEFARWKFYYLDPKRLMREDSPIQSIPSIGPRGEGLSGFLFTLRHKDPGLFESLERTLKLILPAINGIEVVTNEDEGTVRLMVKERTATFPPKLVSEGTLRMLGLVAIFAALVPPTLVGFEEPENGVHPERLSIIRDLLVNQKNSGIQVIVNSHSPEFVEQFSDEQLFVCTRDDSGATRILQLEHEGPLYRRVAIKKALRELGC